VGILDLFRIPTDLLEAGTALPQYDEPDLVASLAPASWPTTVFRDGRLYSDRGQQFLISRNDAMTVPAVARARNIIAGTIASLPMRLYRDTDGQPVNDRPAWVRQPDPMVPLQTTMAWTIDSLLFHGQAYWQVIDVYAESGRPSRFRWIDPTRIGYDLDGTGTVVQHYTIDGRRVPDRGLNSLIVFSSFDDGIIKRAARTVRTAIELERAALVYAETPSPALAIKNTGADLPSSKIDELLSRWKASRQSNAVAYLSAAVDIEKVGFSPTELALNEARDQTVAELARACGIPAWYLGADSGTGMTYQNVGNARRDLIDYSLRPYMDAVTQRLSLDDVTPRGVTAAYDLAEFTRSSPIERAQLAQALIPLGVITPEEWRATEDLAPGGPLA
jgi:HK97 family phage portal protein